MQPAFATAESVEKTKHSEILIKFKEGTTPNARQTLIANLKGKLIKWNETLNVAQIILTIDLGGITNTTGTVVTSARHNTILEFIEESETIVYGTHDETFISNDPHLGDDRAYALQHIDISTAWTLSTGREEIIIAILDTGIDTGHIEFRDRIVAGYDFVNDDDQPADDHGHGTHVAGIIAANINNGTGGAGVCPQCRIMPVKVLNEENVGDWFTIASGIVFAVDNGARIINLSLGATQESETMRIALDYAQSHGVLVIAAVGNYANNQPFYPAAYAHVLGVSATTHQDKRWTLSNYGNYVDVAAPGQDILSTRPANEYQYMSGTSVATPFVTGLAGLLFSHDTSRTMDDIVQLITQTADDHGSPGWDQYYGFGRINAAAALHAEVSISGIMGQENVTEHIYLPFIISS